MLGAGAGRWVDHDHQLPPIKTISYDLNAFAVAKPGAPLTPGNAPPSINEPDSIMLGSRSACIGLGRAARDCDGLCAARKKS